MHWRWAFHQKKLNITNLFRAIREADTENSKGNVREETPACITFREELTMQIDPSNGELIASGKIPRQTGTL